MHMFTVAVMQLEACGAAELGATWLHGLRGHPVYELALQRGLMDGTEKHKASEAVPFIHAPIQAQGGGSILTCHACK